MTNVAKAAAGEPAIIEQIPEESKVGSLQHSFHLRADTEVTLDLPADLSQSEADRLAAFVKTLPLESEED
jgi:hypothetical protein